MDKYKINNITGEQKDINDILISVLNKELKKYIKLICENKKNEVSPSYICLSLSKEGGKN